METRNIGVGFGIILLKKKNILLGKRNDDPAKASSLLHGEGTWTLPGGKMKFGESFEDAAIREVLEETGVKIKTIEVISVSNERVSDAHFVTLGFLSKNFSGKDTVKEPDEITEWKWFPIHKLPEPLFPPSTRIIKNFLTNSFYTPK